MFVIIIFHFFVADKRQVKSHIENKWPLGAIYLLYLFHTLRVRLLIYIYIHNLCEIIRSRLVD